MSTMESFQAGVTPRGNPATRRGRPRRPVILLLLALLSFGGTGCQSGFFGPCGTCRTGLRNFSERVFRPFRARAVVTQPCCGDAVPLGVESVGPLQYGTPSVVVPAPAVTVPAAPSGGAITNPPPSAIDSLPSTLEPLPSSIESRPSASPGPPPASNGNGSSSRSNSGRAGNYEAYRPPFPDEPIRSTRLDDSRNQGPESTERSAQGPARSADRDEASVLDNLPPLDIPRDLSRSAAPEPGLRAERPPAAAPGPAPTIDVGRTDFQAPAPAAESLTVAPGLRRFAGVESKLAGGSLPDAAGLDWLAEKGYKTILDLREEQEISPAFISDVARRGMRYVALPISLTSVDQEHLKRFRFEIGLADSRPLYFFDADGNRAGMLWYIQRVAVDGVDREAARRDAEELGLTDPRFVAAANAYLDASKPAPVPSPVPAEARPEAPAPAADPSTRRESPAEPRVAEEPATPTVADTGASSWRALIPMLVTILGLPVAFIGRSMMPSRGLVRTARASLAGSARTPKSLPSSSDA